MAAKKKKEILPIISSSHIKEDESKVLFAKAIKPWLIINWFTKDYGVDANIEISNFFTNSEEQIATGKRFSLQLKSSTTITEIKGAFSIPIPRDKIIYWYNSSEALMLAFADLVSKKVCYRWIDEHFIQELHQQNPNWLSQETITISFPTDQIISSKELNKIKKYVFGWKRPAKTILTPGNYFKFSKQAAEISKKLMASVQENKIDFLNDEANDIISELPKSIYTITVVGLNRAGKSTLINTLLHKKVSPVDVLPTTGIPISFYPSDENKTTVLFSDKEPIEGGVDDKFLNEYTSQQQNGKNFKKVKYVSVNIVNHMLEKGLALCDVPGLDDASEEVRRITKAAVFSGNAIVYVISVAPFLNGEFSINQKMVEDLNLLGSKMDRVFLVFNKIDKLNDEQLATVKNYIDTQLKDYDIQQYLPCEPIYISSENSFKSRVLNEKAVDDVVELEKKIWEYLLGNNKTGLHKILSALASCKTLIGRYKNTMKMRMTDSAERENTEKEISVAKEEIKKLRNFVSEERQRNFENLKEYTTNSFQNILSHLEAELTSSHGDKFPTKEKIASYLENYAYEVISDVNDESQQQAYNLQSNINQWIVEKLKQVETTLESDIEDVELQRIDVTKYTNQIFSFFQESRGGYIGALETLFGGLWDLIKAIFGNLKDFLADPKEKQEREIKSIMSKATKGYKKIETEFLAELNKYLTAICRKLEEKSIERTKAYLGTLSSKLSNAGKQLQPHELKNYENFAAAIGLLEQEIDSAFTDLEDYTSSIDWLK